MRPRFSIGPGHFLTTMSSSTGLRASTYFRSFCAVTITALFSGCASYSRIANYPTPTQSAQVSVVSKPMSKMSELPIGVFYDEPRQIIISGHQKGLGWGMMFGLVGVMVADQANKSSAEKRFGDSAHGSTTDLGTLTRAVLDEELSAQHAPRWTTSSSPNQLLISPYAVFTVLKSGKARLFAMMRAEIPGADGKPAWSVRYFARAPGEFPIEGDDGWMTRERFITGMRVALRSTLHVCVEDTHGRLNGVKPVKAKGTFPYFNVDTIELPFLVAGEDNDTVVARLAAGDVMVMAGTHVLNRADYTFSEGKFKDPR